MVENRKLSPPPFTLLPDSTYLAMHLFIFVEHKRKERVVEDDGMLSFSSECLSSSSSSYDYYHSYQKPKQED